jgi:hypothetical protein
MDNPYWLLRTPGRTFGFATVSWDDAQTSKRAIETWKASQEPRALALFDGMEINAVLVTMEYIDGQPVVTEVK